MQKLDRKQREALVDVAMARKLPDLAIIGGYIANVHTREIQRADLLISGERIAAMAFSPEEYDLGPETQIIDAHGRLIIPGLIDPHMHPESSSMIASQFARAVVPRGVTTVVADPHELGNVLGVRGMALLLDEARALPINFLLRVPARIPEFSRRLEMSGARVSVEQTRQMLHWEAAVCLAGDILPRWILENDPDQMARIADAIEAGRTISGYSPGLGAHELNALIAAGVEDSHTPKDVDELLDDLRHGLHVLLTPRPYKFEASDFRRLGQVLHDSPMLDSRLLSLCTDDVHANQLANEGHLDHRLRLAIREGIPPLVAIQMATSNTAALLRLERDLGSLAPGKFADIVIMRDMESMQADQVVFHGRLVASGGELTIPLPEYAFPDWAMHSIKVDGPINPYSLGLRSRIRGNEAMVNVLVPGYRKTITQEQLPVVEGLIMPDPDRDILSVAVIDRYHRSPTIGKGFVKGLGIRHGALATSVNHNAHNLVVIGTDFASMAIAVNHLITIGGGYVAAQSHDIIAQVELPVAGLLSMESYETVSSKFEAFERAWREQLGCSLGDHPLWTLDFLCSPVVPDYGITNRGLLHSSTGKLIDVVLLPGCKKRNT